jgi:hypothetical protein
VESGKEWIQSILSGVAARPLIAPKNKRPGCGPGLHSKLFTDLAVVTVMMTVVVTDSGIGRNGGAGQDGDCDGCEQEIAEELHAVGSFANQAAHVRRPGIVCSIHPEFLRKSKTFGSFLHRRS